MTSAVGQFGDVRIKKETTFGTFAGASTAQSLRRRECSIDMDKDTYKSSEIRSSQQTSVFKHGMRKIAGDIKGDPSPGTYKLLMQSFLRRDFATGPTTGALTTIAATSVSFTRSSGSFLTDGFKVGMVIQPSGFVATANNNRRFLVTAVVALTLTVKNMNGLAPTITTEAAGATVTIAAVGKYTYTPATGQTNDSYSIERWWSDISQSRVFLGCRVSSMDINLPPTGIADITFGVMGQDVTDASAQQFTSPTASTTSDGLQAVNGALLIGGVAVGVLTGLSIKAVGNHSTIAVVGSNVTPDVFPGRVEVSGQFTVIFQDSTYRDYFKNETEAGLVGLFVTDQTAVPDFQSFIMPRLKLSSAKVDDKETGPLIVTCSFQALENVSGGTGTSSEATTLAIQDSLA